MTAVLFDTLNFSKQAREHGFTEEQANFQAEQFAKIFEDRLATKEDINDVRKDIGNLKRDLQDIKKEIIIALGGMLAGTLVLLPVVFKLISLI
jgi:polyhydroxyalkanoate synthesis regulator phasin